MRDVIEIEILSVLSSGKPYGKKKTCYPFVCDISINGGSNIEARVITFDAGISRSVDAGKKYEGVENEYKGEVSYILNKEIGSSRSQAPAKTERLSQQTSQPQKAELTERTQAPQPSSGHVVNLQQLSFARSYAKDIVVKLLEKRDMENGEIINLWNTLSDCTMAWFDRYTKTTHPDTAPWGSIIIKEGLVEDVKKKKLDATFLREKWVSSMFAEKAFVNELRSVLAGDDIPF